MTTDPAASGPAQDATGHVDPDRLADLAEGLLDGAVAEAVRAHLASCEQCADDFALVTLDSGLSGFLAPEPIPAEVVARVEAALHREPPLRDSSATVSASAPAAADQHVHHAARPRRGRRFKLAFGALASVGLLVGGVAVGVSMFSGGGETNSTSASRMTSGAAQPNAAGPAQAPTDALAQLQQQATNLLASAKDGGTGSASTTKGRPDNALRTPSSAAGTCWQNPSPAADLLAHSSVTFQGHPAELLVYADPGDSTRAKVVVVAAGCGSTYAKTPGGQAPLSAGGSPAPDSANASPAVVLAETSITRP